MSNAQDGPVVYTLGSERINFLPGSQAVKVQETTRKKYVSRWACTLTVFPDGGILVEDGAPHGPRQAGQVKVDGKPVSSMRVDAGSTVILGDRFSLDIAAFVKNAASNRRPLTVVDVEKKREFAGLRDIERRYNIWDRVDKIASRYGFLSITPVVFSLIRNSALDLKTIMISVVITAFCFGVMGLAMYMKRNLASAYRCPHCHRRLSTGRSLRVWNDLREDNECPRCRKLFHDEYESED